MVPELLSDTNKKSGKFESNNKNRAKIHYAEVSKVPSRFLLYYMSVLST